MKRWIIFTTIFLILVITALNFEKIVTTLVPTRYWDWDIADNDIVVYNPFSDTYADFIKSTELLKKSEQSYNKDSIKYYSLKILSYRNSFNEKQLEKLYSCGNGYWEDKCSRLLIYSKAYENIGNFDSSASVLVPALIINEGFQLGIHDRFFKLKSRKYSKQTIKNEIYKNMSNNRQLDCPNCMDRAFIFQGAEIGFDFNVDMTFEQNKELIISKLGLLK